MKYKFPAIRHINDVLPAIENRPEFIVAEKDGYKVINYNVNMSDTFPAIDESPELEYDIMAERNKIRRECRGIIFCSETGNILRRPYHKFFNIGEREETLPTYINLSEPHQILEKLDGSMIAPFIVQDNLIFGTKMGLTDVAKPVQEYALDNNKYITFSFAMLEMGFSPIFEWCSRKQRIVIDYPGDSLILTAARDIVMGEYMPYNLISEYAKEFNIPVVKSFDPQADINAFIDYTRDLQDTEGFVVRFDDGHQVKLKCDWYVQIHKAKEKILYDRHIVEMILDNTLDDIKPHLLKEDLAALEKFEKHFSTSVNDIVTSLLNKLSLAYTRTHGDRKSFALEYANDFGIFKPLAFKVFGNPKDHNMYNGLIDFIRANLGSNTKYEVIRDNILCGVVFNK